MTAQEQQNPPRRITPEADPWLSRNSRKPGIGFRSDTPGWILLFLRCHLSRRDCDRSAQGALNTADDPNRLASIPGRGQSITRFGRWECSEASFGALPP